MKTHVWVTVPFALAMAASWSACGGSNSSPGTGGHVTTTTTHMTTTSHTTTTTTPPLAACDAPSTAPSHGSCYTPPMHPPPASCHMDGGVPDAGTGASDAGAGDGGVFTCAGSIPNANACGMCVEGSCCAELAACNAVPSCWDCLTNPNADPTTCMGTAITTAIDAITTCQGSCCEDICNPPCNPVTNSGCSATNMEACDIDLNNPGSYGCFSTDGTALCQMCDEMAGPYCAAGMTCLSDGSCAAFCCADSDCGTGKCDKTQLPMETTLGVCVHK